MSCVLKYPSASSPGIAIFTHNEALAWQKPAFRKVDALLTTLHQKGEWIFGVHVQGDCSWLGNAWPEREWHSFFMWPDPHASFLTNVKERLYPKNCVNYMPPLVANKGEERLWDLCVVSRPAKFKRLVESLKITKSLLDRNPKTKVVFILSDPRSLHLGLKSYELQGVDQEFFNLPKKIFTANDFSRISFICSSIDHFGNFPVRRELIGHIVKQSKFLLLTSNSEGTPRVFIESLLAGTPCIMLEELKTGIDEVLNNKNSCRISTDSNVAIGQIESALKSYQNYAVDVSAVNAEFCETHTTSHLKAFLEGLIRKRNLPVEGEWFLHDLHLRLCGHGYKLDTQFIKNPREPLLWIQQVSLGLPHDEDSIIELLSKRKKFFGLFNLPW